MRVLALDVETTTYNKGNLHDQRNELVCYSIADDVGSEAVLWTEGHENYLNVVIEGCSLIVGFNWKFDLGWLKKVGVDFSNVKMWDVQNSTVCKTQYIVA